MATEPYSVRRARLAQAMQQARQAEQLASGVEPDETVIPEEEPADVRQRGHIPVAPPLVSDTGDAVDPDEQLINRILALDAQIEQQGYVDSKKAEELHRLCEEYRMKGNFSWVLK